MTLHCIRYGGSENGTLLADVDLNLLHKQSYLPSQACFRLPWEVISVMLVGGREAYTSFAAQLLIDFNMMYGDSRILQEDLDKCIKWVERKKPRK